MGILKRLSDGFWQYVSPQRAAQSQLPTPTSEPRFKKPAIPTNRRATIDRPPKHAESSSPAMRAQSWRLSTPSSHTNAPSSGIKRKRTLNPSPSAGRKGKVQKINTDSVQAGHEIDELYDDSSLEDDEYDNYGEGSSQHGGHSSHPSPAPNEQENQEANGEAASESQSQRLGLPEENDMAHISTEELRAQGWDDDYIALLQKIAMRGHEPVLSAYMKFEYRFMPDGLFEENDDDAYITSYRKQHFKASKALDGLLQLGGHVRDRIFMDGAVTPEQQVDRQLRRYLEWAFEDADLDSRTAIPIVALEIQPAGTPAATLRANATRKCRRLAERYREALRAKHSIETSPHASPEHEQPNGNTRSNSAHDEASLISYPLPTFYAVVASHAIVAVMAYRPNQSENDEESGVSPMAFFDLKDKNYDVWNALALAILVCHVRNVQLRIALETGLGQRQQAYEASMVDDSASANGGDDDNNDVLSDEGDPDL